MKKLHRLFFIVIGLSFIHTLSSDELDELLRQLDAMIASEQREGGLPPIPQPQPTSSKPGAPQQKKIVPTVQKKDPKTNFLESFSAKDSELLPEFKKEAARSYLSALLEELFTIRRTIASTDVYRRTKFLSIFGTQLIELESYLWELITNDIYLTSFFLPAESALRNSILALGKELAQTNRSLTMPKLQERHIIRERAALEEMLPERSSLNIQLKKLESLLSKKLSGMISSLKSVIQKSGANIEAVKKKNSALFQDAEKRRKEVEGKVASYRPSESFSPSFWDTPYESQDFGYGPEFDGGFGGGFPMDDFFGGGGAFPSGFDNTAQEGFGKGGGLEEGMPEPGSSGGRKGGSGGFGLTAPSKQKEKTPHRKLVPQKESFDEAIAQEKFIKNSIISDVERAEIALEHNDIKTAYSTVEQLNSPEGSRQALAILETTLPESRKSNNSWKIVEEKYQAALKKLYNLTNQINAKIKTEKLNFKTLASNEEVNENIIDAKRKLQAIEIEQKVGIQKIISELRPYFKDIAQIAKIIIEKNKNNILQLREDDLEGISAMSTLSSTTPQENLNEILRNAPLLITPLNALKIVFKGRKENDLTNDKNLNIVLNKIDTIINIITKFKDVYNEELTKLEANFTTPTSEQEL